MGTLDVAFKASVDGDADSMTTVGLFEVIFSVVVVMEGVKVGPADDGAAVGLSVDRSIAADVGALVGLPVGESVGVFVG